MRPLNTKINLAMKYFLTVFLLIILTSCNKSKKNISDVLLDGNCFWDIYDSEKNYKVRSGYRIKPDGSCYRLRYDFIDGKRSDSVYKVSADVFDLNRWDLIDSTLYISFYAIEVLRFNADTVFFKTKDTAQRFFLVKNCKTKSAFENW
ncbi:MAG: hypothetical protein IPH18_05060 [Chitinophagaceae bacterium]|nr:hypothetical protein [Chitinophagaceae bacterium]